MSGVDNGSDKPNEYHITHNGNAQTVVKMFIFFCHILDSNFKLAILSKSRSIQDHRFK